MKSSYSIGNYGIIAQSYLTDMMRTTRLNIISIAEIPTRLLTLVRQTLAMIRQFTQTMDILWAIML